MVTFFKPFRKKELGAFNYNWFKAGYRKMFCLFLLFLIPA